MMENQRLQVLFCCLFFSLFLIAGCAVNQLGLPGLMSVDYSENDHAYRTKLEAWGIHISTKPIDCGITIGYTKRIYIQPKTSTEEIELDKYLPDLFDKSWRAAPPNKETKPGATALLNKSFGLTIQTNRHAIGAMFGIRSFYLIEVDEEYVGIFTVNINNE